MTPYQKHLLNWKNCQRCVLHKGRTQVVFARGDVPADVVFVGEAPGMSEDILGTPFVGPAGKLLDQIVNNAGMGRIRKAFYNCVGCFPKDQKDTTDHRPPQEALDACSRRLREFAIICNPRLVVAVGDVAGSWVDKAIEPTDITANLVKIVHPAAILRANFAQRGLMTQRAIVTLTNALEDLEEMKGV